MKTHGYTFERKQKLRTKAEFAKVFDRPKKVHSPFFLALFIENKEEKPRLAIMVKKKLTKLATERNKIRRIVRESFRKEALPAIDIVILAKNIPQDIANKKIQDDLKILWKKLKT